MKRQIVMVVLLCTTLSAIAQFNSQNLKADYVKANSLVYKKLKIYPIRANQSFFAAHQHIGKYTMLDEAIKQNKIKITEVSVNGEVNKLFIANTSKDSIYLMAGEVVQGGKQDRVLAEDIVLAPMQKKNINSFCVEQGRWTSREMHVRSGSGNGTSAAFTKNVKASSLKIREAAMVKKDQQEVWNEVADKTSKNNARTSTGTYTALEESKAFTDERDAYIRFLEKQFGNDPNIIGIVVASGNKVIGCDLFATHHLFNKQLNNLLHSYVTEAITNGQLVTVNDAAVQAYLKDFLDNENEQETKLKSKGSIYKHKGAKLRVSRFL